MTGAHLPSGSAVQVTTFTDCVNCLIAFTNNPHSLDVSLNAIAFLRFCAMKLAEGAIGAPAVSEGAAWSPSAGLQCMSLNPCYAFTAGRSRSGTHAVSRC